MAHPTSTKLRQDLDRRKKERWKEKKKRNIHGYQLSSNHRPSNNLSRRRTLSSLTVLANLSILIFASIRMPPPRRSALLASDDQYPPSTPAAQPLSVSHAASCSRCCSAADRTWQRFARRAADAVREVQMIPISRVFEREPGRAV